MHEIASDKESIKEFVFDTYRKHLASRIFELVGIVGCDGVKIQSVTSELLFVETAFPGDDRDVPAWQLYRRQRVRVNVYRQTRAEKTGRETSLAHCCRITGNSIEAVDQVTGHRVGADLGVIHTVAAADDRACVAAGIPRKTESRLEIRIGVGQSLVVVSETKIERKIASDTPFVLNKTCKKPLSEIIAGDAVIDRLRIIEDIGERELVQRKRVARCVRTKCECPQCQSARLVARAARLVVNDAAAKTEVMLAFSPGQSVRKLNLTAEQVR